MPAAYSAKIGHEAAYTGMPTEAMPANRNARNTCCSSLSERKNTPPASPQLAPLPSAAIATQRSHCGAVPTLSAQRRYANSSRLAPAVNSTTMAHQISTSSFNHRPCSSNVATAPATKVAPMAIGIWR
jgi:hypothetical protein